jgi:type I restriction enzyme, S subunit
MERARSERRSRFAEADALLRGLDDFVVDAIGLRTPPKVDRTVFAIRRSSVRARFDPHFYLPSFAQTAAALADIGSKPLGDLVEFSTDIWRPEENASPSFQYIEISSVDTTTGDVFPQELRIVDAPSRARMIVRENDIIVSLTRPNLGAIAQVSHDLDGCIASTGFAVLRHVDEKRVSRNYLWCVLRSRLCLDQMLQKASGGNYPAITETELAKLLIPLPGRQAQDRISVEASRRRDEARRLHAEADAQWQLAKNAFENQIAGASQP